MKRKILTVQSQVANGYVGNNLAALAIQLHGLDPVQLPTVLLSNHVEYPEVYGRAVLPALFLELLKGIKANHFTDEAAYLISGFCNDASIISILSRFITEIKSQQDFKYVYDPVFGDARAGGLYIPRETADQSILQLLPLSDIITPNRFELEFILGEKITSENQLLAAIAEHEMLHTKTVIATGIEFTGKPLDMLDVALYKDGHRSVFSTRKIPIEVIGAGDLFAATIAAQLNLYGKIEEAIDTSMRYLSAIFEDLYRTGTNEFTAEVMLKHAALIRNSY